MYTKKFLDLDFNVVVDRCNFDVDQRKTWVQIAGDYGVPVDCIVFTAGARECAQRIMTRKDHPTGVQGSEGQEILRRFVKNYSPPSADVNEGFRKILRVDPSPDPVCTDERISSVLQQLEDAPIVIYK
ncbi:hypothetical protein DM01DRAFT_1341056 [Hesseltinella vesiculosa]|uniref:P-loop containing nucleoside triphosphate hydrolase protein n=1 Tax=Hesseltinella vesiculosa TaxID=101127 RepID=A0A1X2G276_9FUNG|nr:hypothetical protein DM01DRAFT_1341056 [Hesseltinella vesiculosa]